MPEWVSFAISPTTALGTVILGVVGGLIAQAIWGPLQISVASLDAARRERYVRSKLKLYEGFANDHWNGRLNYMVAYYQTRVIVSCIVATSFIAFSILFVMYLQSSIAPPETPEQELIISRESVRTVTKAFSILGGLASGSLVFLFSKAFADFRDIIRFGRDPEKFRERLILDLRKVDPDFDSKRLPPVTPSEPRWSPPGSRGASGSTRPRHAR